MSSIFTIKGAKPLNGEIKVSGSKNATLPIICASLLSNNPVTLTNVPDISDVRAFIEIFQTLNVKTIFEQNTLKIDPTNISISLLPEDKICQMRASILLLAPLLHRFGQISMPFPGGCVLGKRSVNTHTYALTQFGVQVQQEMQLLDLKIVNRKATKLILPEMSVTATENAIMFAVLTSGFSEIRLAATEPHVVDLCNFLNHLGAKISGIGTSILQIEGVNFLSSASPYEITGDYLEAGTFAIASLITNGNLIIKGVNPHDLDLFLLKLKLMGANLNIDLTKKEIHITPSRNLTAISIQTSVHPGFPTDLQAPFSILMSQAKGESHIFETLFEGRLNYLFELEKMGANINILNPHQAIIQGPTKLTGVPIASIDIRAGAAMVLAGLCAEGTTEISNIKYIDRGYENFEKKLISLGADISRT